MQVATLRRNALDIKQSAPTVLLRCEEKGSESPGLNLR